jgi:hypothetical protein
LPGELTQQGCDQYQDNHEGNQLWLPLQHSVSPLRFDGQTCRILLAGRGAVIPRAGDYAEYDLGA